MQFRPTTVLGLFDSSKKHFIIPVYQRAYSWDIEQLNVFLSDLKEQIQGDKDYYLGNILLETIKKEVEYEIIDGQQRLTTVIIFMRALVDTIQKRSNIEIDIDEKKRTYFKNGGNIKLRPVEYDRSCFDSLIVEGNSKFEVSTPSQIRIKKAKTHFKKELETLSSEILLQLIEKIEGTELTCIELIGKNESALMFELQNNRGKDLTNMERIKSYFMYQMYVYSKGEETENNIQYISDVFKHIYMIINDLKNLDEDSVLIYHCNAYIKGFLYRTIDDIKEVFADSTNKVDWMKQFVNELHTTFANMKKFESCKLTYIKDLRRLGIPAFVYPFVIKGYKYFGEDDNKLDALFHILEVVVFRYKLVSSRADLISRLNEVLKAFNGDLTKLKNHTKDKLNEARYWGDARLKEALDGYMYDNSVLRYLLWKYEGHLQRKGYKMNDYQIENEQIEHISPRNPTNGEAIASGYEINSDKQYDEEFIKEYLNCVGNLMLISGSHNSSIGNKPFKKKLKSFIENPILKQQLELQLFINPDKIVWNKKSIDKRHLAIVDNFALKKWDFDNVLIPN